MGSREWELRRGSAKDPIRCAIFISGSGSGMEAMVRYQQANPSCGHKTGLVFSDRPDARGLERAAALGIDSVCIPLSTEISDPNQRRLSHEKLILTLLAESNIDLVLLSGYMRLVSPSFVEQWAPYLINIHPSLLPAFPGAHAHRDVLMSGVHVSGCTVHHVDAGMDTGEILGQCRVPVFSDDDESSLAERVKIEEHRLYPTIIDQLVKQEFNPRGN
jgi:formyltetrahydrofolate-dependent phosphoribosylglycinamide formyltransferase